MCATDAKIEAMTLRDCVTYAQQAYEWLRETHYSAYCEKELAKGLDLLSLTDDADDADALPIAHAAVWCVVGAVNNSEFD
jgi:hypothetical protein